MTPTVVVTRPRASNNRGSSTPNGVSYLGADRLVEKVSQSGFSCVHLPVLTISRLPLTPPLSQAINRLSSGYYTWLVLLSPSAVYACKDAWQEVCAEGLFPKATKVALQGPGTAEAFLTCFSRTPDLIPDLFLAEELAKSLSNTILSSGAVPSANVLLLQAKDGRDVVAPVLSASGANVECFPLYATEETPLAPEIKHSISIIPEREMILLFMSPSAVRATTQYLDVRHKKYSAVLCVGPITAQAAKECGYERIVESKDHSEEGILALLCATFGSE